MKKALKEAWIPVLLIVFMIQCINCTNNTEVENLKFEILIRDRALKEYENFRQLSKDIYINQVDSTGDGFDETDKGVDFWNIYERIDTLVHTIEMP